MFTSTKRSAYTVGALALAVSGLTGVAAETAQAATARNGVCEAGELCLYYNSNQQGSLSDFTSSLGQYNATQPTCYEFRGAGAGKGMCIKNQTASVWNRTGSDATIFENSDFGGRTETVPANGKANLTILKNNNASHRIGGGSTPAPTPGVRTNMSTALYSGGGGSLTTGFDGYTRTPGKHEGIDFAKGSGARVNSLVDGQVIRVANDGIRTLAIYVPSADKTVIYLHTNPTVREGATVRRGDQVAKEAANGAGGSVHTHVEMRPGRQTYAAKSVRDWNLENPNPTSFWQSQGYNVR